MALQVESAVAHGFVGTRVLAPVSRVEASVALEELATEREVIRVGLVVVDEPYAPVVGDVIGRFCLVWDASEIALYAVRHAVSVVEGRL
jgi:hypothetical protein